MPQTINVSDASLKTIPIGRQGENEVNQITFDFKDWYELIGDGTLQLLLIRPTESTPYPITLIEEDTNAVWNVSSTDTAIKGSGKAQLLYIINEKIKKSKVYNIEVFESLEEDTEQPDQYESWLADLLQAASDVQSKVSIAEQASEDALLYKNSAQRSAESAEASAEEARQSVESVQGVESTIRTYVESAETSATNASTSESNARASESNARTYAETSTTNAQNAQNSENNASQSASNASQSASNASASAEQARQFAEQARQAFTFTDTGNGNIIITRVTGGN